MALIRCPECGREISQYADKCPGCGWPVPKPTAREGNYSECSNYEDSYEEYLRQRRQAQRRQRGQKRRQPKTRWGFIGAGRQ